MTLKSLSKAAEHVRQILRTGIGGGGLAMPIPEDWIMIIRNRMFEIKKLKSLFFKTLTISKTNKPLAHMQESCSSFLLYINIRYTVCLKDCEKPMLVGGYFKEEHFQFSSLMALMHTRYH